ncbi:MAG: hypothetical protein HQL46_08495 [Gammaproteobacteria bacterium]|nr:hypothetical protein [Gammaproteobacteria bacterium]
MVTIKYFSIVDNVSVISSGINTNGKASTINIRMTLSAILNFGLSIILSLGIE